jgi:hypothetical protein
MMQRNQRSYRKNKKEMQRKKPKMLIVSPIRQTVEGLVRNNVFQLKPLGLVVVAFSISVVKQDLLACLFKKQRSDVRLKVLKTEHFFVAQHTTVPTNSG